MSIKTYSELIRLPTFKERYRYLQLGGKVGEETFGFDRWINQRFYKDDEWRAIRDYVIVRDNGCDLAMPDREIPDGVKILIHHMNPIRTEDILRRTKFLLDPEYLISTQLSAHHTTHVRGNLIERGESIGQYLDIYKKIVRHRQGIRVL